MNERLSLPLDHILWAVPQLEEGMAFFEGLTGVAPRLGGRHPGRGTRNAIVPMGESTYLEIIAPDPLQVLRDNLGALIKQNARTGILTFAVQCADMESLADRAKAAGLPFQGPEDWSRDQPDGKVLRWRLAFTEGSSFGRHLPLYIDWQDSPHPSGIAPTQMSLLKFEVTHQNAEELKAIYSMLGIDIPVRRGDRAAMRAVLRGPQGELALTS